jgi:GDPmannose 4,6-dehydratase
VTGAAHAPRALITGLTGQDGSFLAELLLECGYRVTGLVRPQSRQSLGAAGYLRDWVDVIEGDLLDTQSLIDAVASAQPDELYHLAAPSRVPDSWIDPAQTMAAIAGSGAALLQAVRDHSPDTRVFMAVSSTIFGHADESPQREETSCRPVTPYATAKLATHQLVGQFRAHHGLHACSGILYNHESERRPDWFVSRKITRAAAAVKLGLASELSLGDLDAVRDWSFAGDIVRGAWLILQQEEPDDFVLASGVGHTVSQLADIAFGHLGLDARDHVRVDPELVRPADPVPAIGDPAKARTRLGWEAAVTFEELIRRMVDADVRSLEQRRR